MFYFLVLSKTFLVIFSLCSRLNWQLACQFSSANHSWYRTVSCKQSNLTKEKKETKL